MDHNTCSIFILRTFLLIEKNNIVYLNKEELAQRLISDMDSTLITAFCGKVNHNLKASFHTF